MWFFYLHFNDLVNYFRFTWNAKLQFIYTKKLQNKISETTLKIHNDFNLGTYSRTDFIVVEHNFFTLEVNTIPGLTSGSLMPKQAKAAGINFNEFIEELVNSAK